MKTAPVEVAGQPAVSEATSNRFHVASVAFLRAKQLQAGAKPRVPSHRHKPVRIALLEVMAEAISWSLNDAPRPATPAAPAADV
jgi:DNA-directed RNA polymerase subunit K/omega